MIDGMAQQTLEPPREQRRTGRGKLFWSGVALVVLGLGLLGYVAWQFFGTNVVSHHKQRQIVEQTQRSWSHQAGPSGHVAGRDLAGAQALVRIPAFGKNYVVPVGAGVTNAVLAEGLGHFNGTVGPGQVGNYALAGHRVTHGEPLRDLPLLRPGDQVVVETRTRTFTYRIDTDPNDLIVTFNDVWVLDRLPTNPGGGTEPDQRPGQRLITLTTCSELFHTDNRMITFGHLVDSRPT
jgi:sortase A